jgi:lysophospholipase L1-like esterase
LSAMNGVPAVLVVLALAVAGCGGDDDPEAKATPKPWSLVALGDSVAVALPECDGCTSFVDLWAKGLSQAAKRRVRVSNHAVPDAGATEVLDQVKRDGATRTALKRADLVVVALGINDTPWNRRDDPCDAAAEYPVIEWGRIGRRCISRVTGEYEATFDAILDELDTLRAGKPTVLRVTTVYNAVIGNHVDPSWDSPAALAPSKAANELFATTQCRLAQHHGGACVEVHRTFNGPNGSRPAKPFLASDYTHPGPKGHQAIAQLLLTAGVPEEER